MIVEEVLPGDWRCARQS